MFTAACCKRLETLHLRARLLDQRGLLMHEHGLHLFDVRHLRNSPPFGDIAISLELREALSEMCNLQMTLAQFPDLTLCQQRWPAVPSQFHKQLC